MAHKTQALIISIIVALAYLAGYSTADQQRPKTGPAVAGTCEHRTYSEAEDAAGKIEHSI